MNVFERSLLFAAVLLAGCGTTRNVAVSSYHVTRGAAVGSYKVARAVAVGSYRVASAPVRYATRKSSSEPTMVGTTEATSSDVSQPDQPMPPEIASAPQSAAERRQSRTSSEVPRTTRKETAQSSTRSGSSRASAPEENFPTAKAVPDKPGYVFSPFARERYVDVSGYASGTKVKDPWTDKIFVVP
ncbi:MAG: hypothetical protein DME76_11835 [Verrucomicrobia bacterium]|nr:MAG: hypothetical protein DME76_11835 [Verrucomicrobiota bacterium]